MFSAFDTVSADSSIIYVNDSGGNDDWNGQYAEWISDLSGPKKSIKNATGTIAEGGTVNIADGNYTGVNNTNILIDKNMTIKGQSRDSTIINGTNLSQIFQIQNGVNVTIANLTLANGNAINGGAILNYGNLTVENCSFIGNNATYGGAILNLGNLTVIDSYFSANNANSSGAISNSGTLNIKNTKFNGNTASNMGGAIYNAGDLTVSDSDFIDNKAISGGAIYNYADLGISGNLNVKNCTFTGNQAIGTASEAFGGAIFNFGTLIIENSTFTSNSAIKGGAIYNKGSSILNNVTFVSNVASSGGAIYNCNLVNLTIKNSTFKSNTATSTDTSSVYGGGAIYNGQGNLSIETSYFTNNTSNQEGGAIFNWYGNSGIIKCTFEGNTANNGHGGAIYHTGTSNIISSIFTDNIAKYGGAIYNDYESEFKIDGCILNITNSTFEGNIGTENAGAIYNDRGTMNINDSNFAGNTAGYGGVIYNNHSLIIKNSTFTSNHANASGGVVSNHGTLTINGSTFTSNNIDYGYGAVIENWGSVIVKGSDFTGNTAVNYGGAIYNNGGSVDAHFCRFVGNSAYSGKDIYGGGSVNVDYNWWGSNAGPSTGRVVGSPVNYWLVLTIAANPAIIKSNSASKITADLLHDNNGNYHDPASGHILDGTAIIFNTKLGTINSPSFTVNGTAQSYLNGGLTNGVANVSAAFDSEIVSILVTVDTIPPTVSSIDPVDKAKIKIVNKEIKITFSEPIQVGSAYNSISVTGPSGAISITKSISGNVLTLTPTSNYVDGVYSVNIPAGAVTDMAGNDLVAGSDSTFTVDTTAPIISSNDPSNNAKIKIIDKAITITFSEPIQAGSAYDSISVTGPSGTVLMSKSINGNVLTLTPISNYVEGSYSINIPINAITDLTGNDLVSAFTSGFIIDATKPTVSANSTGGLFNTSQSILLTANDNLDPSPVIHYTTDGTNWYQFTGSGTVLINNEGVTNLEFYTVDAVGNPSAHIVYSYKIDKTAPVVTATPTSGLANSISVTLSSESNAKIYYRINSGAWNTFTGSGKVLISSAGTNKLEFYAVDAAGNPSAHKTYTYTIDKTAPKVTSTYPKNRATGVSRTAKIYLKFSEKIKTNINWSKIVVKNKYGQTVSISKSISGNILYIQTKSKRASYSYYTVYIPKSAVKDYAGNNLAVGYTFKFKTGRY